ncbi:MAG: hypothetical protein WB661_02735 [Candidatus Bathyarchaeia archaeon]
MPVIGNRRAKRVVMLSAVDTIMRFRLGIAEHTLIVTNYKGHQKGGFATNIVVTSRKHARELVALGDALF